MTPLFCVPDSADGAAPVRAPGYRAPAGPRRARGRANSRPAGGRENGAPRAGKTAPRKDTAELLAVTAEWLRRALARSFLRYSVAGDLEAAVHAAMNVVEPVLAARDTEILRLRGLMGGRTRAR